MSTELSCEEILEREFLPIRAKILEIAASFDRFQRAEGNLAEDARLQRLQTAIKMILAEEPDRAEQIQLLFSRTYDQQWQHDFDLAH